MHTLDDGKEKGELMRAVDEEVVRCFASGLSRAELLAWHGCIRDELARRGPGDEEAQVASSDS